MTSIINSTSGSESKKNSNLLALVTAAELMTSETKLYQRNPVDSSLSVVSASDDDEGMSNKLVALDNSDASALSEDDDLTPRQPRAPPPKTQPGAPPPAPPPPPPPAMIRLESDNGTLADARVSGVVPTSPSGVVSGSSDSSSPVVLHHSSNNKPQSLPITLMNLLTNDEYHEILSFLPHGKCFLIKQTKEFTKKLMQQHFHLSKFGSFVSRLQRWGFAHLQDSILPGQHAFYHPLFQKGKWEPLGKMMYQAKSTKALKNKLTKSMKSRAGLNQLRTTAGRNNLSPTATESSNNPRLLGDLAAVSQSTVNHATQNIVDAAIACLRRDQELLAMPRLAEPEVNNNRNVFSPATSPMKNTMVPAPAPPRRVSRSMMEPLPPIPPVPTSRHRPSFGVQSTVGGMTPPGRGMQVNVPPNAYHDGLLRSATSQMMLWKHQQQPGGLQMLERPSYHPRPAPMMNAGSGGSPMGVFRGDMYLNNKPRVPKELMMPHQQAPPFAPVNSFFP